MYRCILTLTIGCALVSGLAMRGYAQNPDQTKPDNTKVNERDRRSLAAAVADRDDFAAVGDIELLDRNRHSKDDRVERQGQFLFERRVKPDALLGRSVRIHDCLFNQFVEAVRAD